MMPVSKQFAHDEINVSTALIPPLRFRSYRRQTPVASFILMRRGDAKRKSHISRVIGQHVPYGLRADELPPVLNDNLDILHNVLTFCELHYFAHDT